MSSGDWYDGKPCRTLEKVIARHMGADREGVIATSSCTAALAAATRFLLHNRLASNRQSYLPVKICPLTYASTWAFVKNVEWVDCSPYEDGWPENPVDIGVELWGRPWPIEMLGRVTILDAAHRALDPRHGQMLADEQARAVCYSFGPQKEVSCIMGGALVLPCSQANRTSISQIRAWLNDGAVPNERAPAIFTTGEPLGGYRGRLPSPLAAWISAQINRQRYMKKHRQNVLKWYQEYLGKGMLTREGEASGHIAVYKAGSPGEALAIQRSLTKAGCEHSRHYTIPEALKDQCPNAYALSRKIITLPCHYQMQYSDVRRVARRVIDA
jgi:dTDP-4-amino-4,6-dideoxygalactose transaminase